MVPTHLALVTLSIVLFTVTLGAHFALQLRQTLPRQILGGPSDFGTIPQTWVYKKHHQTVGK
ncbi:hypothetical protein IWQ61_002647 [Dispira simplex]|nr:hypothetical protein IWQ61_002647 [Dispira simplex]